MNSLNDNLMRVGCSRLNIRVRTEDWEQATKIKGIFQRYLSKSQIKLDIGGYVGNEKLRFSHINVSNYCV